MAAALASLGYPGFQQFMGGDPAAPAELLVATLSSPEVEVRVIEALPWLLLKFDIDWNWLVREANARGIQNRLGFIVTLARQVAEHRADSEASARFREVEQLLAPLRSVREDTLCQISLSPAERRWLRQARSPEAGYWNLLTDLKAQLLPYAA